MSSPRNVIIYVMTLPPSSLYFPFLALGMMSNLSTAIICRTLMAVMSPYSKCAIMRLTAGLTAIAVSLRREQAR